MVQTISLTHGPSCRSGKYIPNPRRRKTRSAVLGAVFRDCEPEAAVLTRRVARAGEEALLRALLGPLLDDSSCLPGTHGFFFVPSRGGALMPASPTWQCGGGHVALETQ